MSRRYFVGTNSKQDNGFMMASCGCANDNSGDYIVTTNGLHADEVPSAVADAKTCSQLIAGLLNAYFNGVDISKMKEQQIIEFGLPLEEKNIPHPDNTELPF